MAEMAERFQCSFSVISALSAGHNSISLFRDFWFLRVFILSRRNGRDGRKVPVFYFCDFCSFCGTFILDYSLLNSFDW